MKCNLESFIDLIQEKKDLIRGNFCINLAHYDFNFAQHTYVLMHRLICLFGIIERQELTSRCNALKRFSAIDCLSITKQRFRDLNHIFALYGTGQMNPINQNYSNCLYLLIPYMNYLKGSIMI